MTRASRIIPCAASVAALSALTMFDAAVASHFIRPCGDDCRGGGWVATGTMRSARELHTATLLANGRVAVAGGVSNDNAGRSCCTATATAEIYDPATGTWTPTGSTSTGRFWYDATVLKDGRVLVTGGYRVGIGGGIAHVVTMLFDPATRAWSHAGVCRFWSGQSFAPKSSHLYTPYADECAKLMHDTMWMYERHALYVAMRGGRPALGPVPWEPGRATAHTTTAWAAHRTTATRPILRCWTR